ncbi:dihydrofolate reductase [Streptomyces sp. SCUT-3]|uniref:dihydrofolate reductase family protein n=1 Tax=Streptomyces sp. SCUT-3 TaxID=2684469 RepID=UPI000CAF2CEE|nr:dihydrofolate reductase family protein [Streptomyces sp. SCUT-3]PLW74655.1 deaminase [Streptomyces sp. DJ]QMV22536.1 dihydrofolate reductase [Streptomyces sp. SCUT-3]
MRKLTYFVAASIDGFIGAPDGDGDFFNQYLDEEFIGFLKTEYPETLPTQAHALFGLDGFEKRHFDVIVQGRRSYQVALDVGITSPYAHLRQLVASRGIGESPDPAVEIVSDDLVGRVRELKEEDGAGIYLCGGSQLAGELLDEIDELVIKTYPVVLGSGMPMFASGFRLTDFALESVRTFGSGALVRKYGRKR